MLGCYEGNPNEVNIYFAGDCPKGRKTYRVYVLGEPVGMIEWNVEAEEYGLIVHSAYQKLSTNALFGIAIRCNELKNDDGGDGAG